MMTPRIEITKEMEDTLNVHQSAYHDHKVKLFKAILATVECGKTFNNPHKVSISFNNVICFQQHTYLSYNDVGDIKNLLHRLGHAVRIDGSPSDLYLNIEVDI